jgi:bacterioferritin-associated ferredoxin
MYICICHAVSDSAIRHAVEEGVNNFRDLSFRTGCGTQCGSCVQQAREIMDQTLEELGQERSKVSLEITRTG